MKTLASHHSHMRGIQSHQFSKIVFAALLVIAFSFAINAQADWTRVYCKYQDGLGATICDSGNVPGDSASCPIAEAGNCAEEGIVRCWSEESCSSHGYEAHDQAIFSVNWDIDSADCDCKAGPGRYNGNGTSVTFETGLNLQNCCGDDPAENYAGPENGKSCDSSAKFCCDNPNDVVLNGQCTQLNGGCPTIGRVYWANMLGQEITAAQVDDYVQLVAEAAFSDGLEIKFTVWEDDPTQCYQEIYSKNASAGAASILWKIKACSDGSTDGNIFRAEVVINPSASLQAPKLIVDPTPNNTRPAAIIDNPTNGQIFNMSDAIYFNSSSVDEDDPLTYNWQFGDGISNPEQNTSHLYTYGGPKLPRLTVTDARGASDTAQVSILIDSPLDDAPLAVITSPSVDEVFYGLLITFDARDSTDDQKYDRAIGCISSSGKCWENLTFTWQFDEGPVYQAQGTAGAYFTRLFSKAGPHSAKLTVDDADPIAETETRFSIDGCSIKVNSNYEYVSFSSCSIESRHYFCNSTGGYYDTLQQGCEGADSTPLTYDDCCPRGYYCPSAGAACLERTESCANVTTQIDCQNVGCIWLSSACQDPDSFSSCSDYTIYGQTACESDIMGLGKSGGRGLGTEVCGRSFSGVGGGYVVPKDTCRCEWDASASSCKFAFESNSSIGGNSFIKCSKTYNLSSCAGGNQQLSWTADIQPPAQGGNPDAINQCAAGSKSIKCGTPVTQLNFFTLPNVIAFIIIIMAYYFLTMNKTEKQPVRKRSKKKA